MKYLFLSVLLLLSVIGKSQLIYLGDDDVQKGNIDGYAATKRTAGMVMLD